MIYIYYESNLNYILRIDLLLCMYSFTELYPFFGHTLGLNLKNKMIIFEVYRMANIQAKYISIYRLDFFWNHIEIIQTLNFLIVFFNSHKKICVFVSL